MTGKKVMNVEVSEFAEALAFLRPIRQAGPEIVSLPFEIVATNTTSRWPLKRKLTLRVR